MSQGPALDIVIVSFNARHDLEACLASLVRHPPSRPWQVIVVDNASSDGAPDVVPDIVPHALVLRQPTNLGFARACNLGIRAGRAPLVLLLNGDTLVTAGALDLLIDELERTPEAAAAGPRLVDADGRPELSFGRMLAPWTELRQKALGRLLARDLAVARWLATRLTSVRHYPDWVSGACLLVWRADAERVGLLDERFFMYTEDVDFCAALRARQRRILFTPAATIVHRRGRSVAAAPDATRWAYRRSQVAFYEKHRPRWAPVLRTYLRLRGHWPPPPSRVVS